MTDEFEGRQMSEWQAATVALLVAFVVAALAWAAIDPDGVRVATEASSQLWMKIHDQHFSP